MKWLGRLRIAPVSAIIGVVCGLTLACAPALAAAAPSPSSLVGPGLVTFNTSKRPPILNAQQRVVAGTKGPNGTCHIHAATPLLAAGQSYEIRELAVNTSTCVQLVEEGNPSSIPRTRQANVGLTISPATGTTYYAATTTNWVDVAQIILTQVESSINWTTYNNGIIGPTCNTPYFYKLGSTGWWLNTDSNSCNLSLSGLENWTENTDAQFWNQSFCPYQTYKTTYDPNWVQGTGTGYYDGGASTSYSVTNPYCPPISYDTTTTGY